MRRIRLGQALRLVLLSLAGISACYSRVVTNPATPPANLPQVRVVLHELKGGYATHADFAMEAGRRLELALNSVELRREIANGRFRHGAGRTSGEILESILAASEATPLAGSAHVVDLRLRTITMEDDGAQWLKWCEPGSRMRTIGVDGNGTGFVATCPQHLDQWAEGGDYATLAGHMMHEYMHLLGYSHPRPGKRKSAVYVIGDLAEEAVRKSSRP